MELLAFSNQQETAPSAIIFGYWWGPDTTGAHLKILWYGHPIFVSIVFLWVVILGLASWKVASQMRRRIKDDIGMTADEGDLTSIETWMKVDEVEEKKNPGCEWAPGSVDLGPDDHRRIDLFPKKKDSDRWFVR